MVDGPMAMGIRLHSHTRARALSSAANAANAVNGGTDTDNTDNTDNTDAEPAQPSTRVRYQRKPNFPTVCCAVLCCAVLCCAVLCCAVLCCAVLCCAVLCCAVLWCYGGGVYCGGVVLSLNRALRCVVVTPSLIVMTDDWWSDQVHPPGVGQAPDLMKNPRLSALVVPIDASLLAPFYGHVNSNNSKFKWYKTGTPGKKSGSFYAVLSSLCLCVSVCVCVCVCLRVCVSLLVRVSVFTV